MDYWQLRESASYVASLRRELLDNIFNMSKVWPPGNYSHPVRSVVFSYSQFVNDIAMSQDSAAGGAILIGLSPSWNTSILNSQFANNSCSLSTFGDDSNLRNPPPFHGAIGGAICGTTGLFTVETDFVRNDVAVIFRNPVIEYLALGGAIVNKGFWHDYNSTLYTNGVSACGGLGGAVMLPRSNLHLKHTKFMYNYIKISRCVQVVEQFDRSSIQSGAALYLINQDSDSQFQIEDCVFANNSAVFGGGIFIKPIKFTKLLFSGTVFSGNIAD
jgi:hypothetical protein